MKKFCCDNWLALKKFWATKTFLSMRLTFYILLLATIQSVALDSYAQATKLNLALSNTSVKQVLSKIEDMSEFYFLYNSKIVDVERKISVNFKNKKINEALDLLFKDTPVSYNIVDRQIVLSGEGSADIRSISAQQKTLTGKVTDKEGLPLPGVTVLVKGTTQGTVTNVDGNYTITNIPENATLVFSFVGMRSQEVVIGNQTSINIEMEVSAIGIEEVVAVGYGTQKKVNLTGAVNIITNEKLTNRQAPTVSQLLQGLIPGGNFSVQGSDGFEPGAEMNITIRGVGSLNGGAPYIIIDGFPGDINSLNPSDIESISVLKDAAASAIYGSSAPYGVILIKTKSGKKKEKMSISYSGNVFISTPPPLPESLDSYTYARVLNEAGDNRGGWRVGAETMDRIIAYQNEDWEYIRQSIPNWPEGATNFGAFPIGNKWNNSAQNYANNDWWDIYYGHSVNQKHNLSLKGGTSNLSYYFSAGLLDQSGVLNYGIDDFKRINVVGKLDFAITSFWDFSWESRFSQRNRERFNSDRKGQRYGTYNYTFRQIARAYPLTPMYDGWGNLMSEAHIPAIEAGSEKNINNSLWNNFKTEIRPAKNWKINADFAYNQISNVRSNEQLSNYYHNVDNTLAVNGNSVPDGIERSLGNNYYWSTNIYSSYDMNINDIHAFHLLVGAQFEYGNYTQLFGSKTNLIVDAVPSLQTATGIPILTEVLSHTATQGYFSRLTYNYKEKYLFESNFRYDGSYVFRPGNQWGLFPSFSLGWNIHKEPFWNNLEKYINTLKVRGSWGQLGNHNISPYSDIQLIPLNFDQLDWIFGYGNSRPVGYASPPSIINRNLTWETAITKDIGFDLTFLDNKLQANLDLFERLTTNMVGPSEAKPGVLGASVPKDNNSELRTRGWELGLIWRQRLNRIGLSYFVEMNLYDYKSQVAKYNNPTGILSTWYKGNELGSIWGYTVYDLYRTQSDLDNYLEKVDLTFLGSNWMTGDVKYEDTNNDDKVDNGNNTLNDHGDLSIIGNTEPHYQYGISAGIDFKGLDFSMVWRGVAKQDMVFFDGSTLFWGFKGQPWEVTLQPRNLDYFRDQPGTRYTGLYEGDANINLDAYWPRPYLNSSSDRKNKNFPNTRYLQDGSYLRLQNVQLGYSFPKKIFSKLNLEKMRIYFSGENLITFTKLPNGIDPVAPVGTANGSFYSTPGTGRMTYGAERIYSLGITVTY